MAIGKNMAPKRVFDELRMGGRTLNRVPFVEAIARKYDISKSQNQEAYIEACEVGRNVANARMNKMMMLRNVRTGGTIFRKRDSKYDDRTTAGSPFQFYSTKLTAEWLMSRPEIDPVCQSDDDQIESYLADVNIIADYYSKKFFTSQYEQQESLSAQDYGTWVTRYKFDPHTQDIARELLDFPACRWDIRFFAEDSSFFIYESKWSTGAMEMVLNADIPSDGNDGEHYGLDLIEQIATQGGNVKGWGKERLYGNADNIESETVVTEFWMQPEYYADIVIDKGEETVCGCDIPEGPLVKSFPNGLCAVGINGMQTIIGLYEEDHRDHIVSGIYHLQSFSGYGKGISDAVDIKKELDTLTGAQIAYAKAHATPGFAFDKDVITEEYARKIGQPRVAIPINFANARDGVNNVNQLIQPLIPGNPGNIIQYLQEHLMGQMQLAMGVTEFSGGLPNVNNKTATGAKIGDANAETLLVPVLQNKASHRTRSLKVIFNLFKKYKNAPQFFSTRTKNSITAGRTIDSRQFQDVDIDFEVVANSEMPQTPYQEQQALSQLFQFTGGLPGLLQALQVNPDITAEVLDKFGIKGLSIAKGADIARVCRKRLEQAKTLWKQMQFQMQVAQAVGMQMDQAELANIPYRIAAQLRISPYERFAPQKAQWFADLLDSDELQYEDPMIRQVTEALIDVQLQADTLGQAQIQQDKNLGSIIANMPMLLGDAAMSQQNQQIQQEYQQQQAQQQQQQQMGQQALQLVGEKQAAQIEQQKAAAAHQQSLAINDQQHSQRLAEMNQQHANQAIVQSAQSSQDHDQALQLEALRQRGQQAA